MATNAAVVEERAVSIARIFERAFSTIGSNALTMFGIAFLFGALPGALVQWGSEQLVAGTLTERIMQNQSIAPVIAVGVVTIILFIAITMISQGALVRATIAHSEGQRASLGDCLKTGLAMALPLLGMGILLGLGVMAGFVLLFVPGVILYVMWSVATPALVAERPGIFGAFGRSRALTKGARWKVFALQLIIFVFYWMASAALGVLLIATTGVDALNATGAAAPTTPIWYLVVSTALQTVIVAIWGAIQTSLYVELRNWKDGPAAQALSEIFA